MLVVRLGACPHLSGLGFAALCGCGGCVSWSLSRPGRGAQLWFPATPGWGLLVVLCSPFACPPSSFSLPRRLARCSPGAVPGPARAVVGVRWGWVGGEASLALARVPSSVMLLLMVLVTLLLRVPPAELQVLAGALVMARAL